MIVGRKEIILLFGNSVILKIVLSSSAWMNLYSIIKASEPLVLINNSWDRGLNWGFDN